MFGIAVAVEGMIPTMRANSLCPHVETPQPDVAFEKFVPPPLVPKA